MRSIVPLAALVSVLGGCAQLIGLDDVGFRGIDGATDAPFDGPGSEDASDAGATCDANTQLDPKNCGRCGHDCLGADCSYGACGALVVTSGTYLSASLATDGVRVFYRDQTSVRSCPVGGCDAGELLASAPANSAGAIAAGPTAVYWSDGTAVRSCTKTACAQPKDVFDASPLAIDGVGTSASHVYVTAHTSLEIALFQSALDGTSATQLEQQANATATGAVAARPQGGVYWYETAPSPTVFYCASTCASGPTASRVLAAAPTGIIATDSAVFVATLAGIFRMDDALASPPAAFYAGAASAIANGSGAIFFVSPASPDRIGACSTAGSACASPMWLYTTTTSSYPLVAIAADGIAVYWIVRGAEQIMKVSP